MTIVMSKLPSNPFRVMSNGSINKEVNIHVKFCEELIDKLINRIVSNNCRLVTHVSMNS